MTTPMPAATHPRPDSAAAGTRWHLQLLGGLQARRGDQTLTQLGGRNAAALLARLALYPQRNHAREELIELLWPGVEIEAGRNRLRQALFGLRQVFEPPGAAPIVQADRLSLRIAPGIFDCDVLQFEHAVRDGRHADALALYGGELLPGFYDEWIADERLRLEGLHDRVTGLAPSQLVAAARPETAAAAQAPSDVGRSSMPVFLTRFFGREAEAARLRDEVRAHRLVTLLGAGGSGKTRIAVELATALRQPVADTNAAARFDFCAFVSLIDCRTGEQVMGALLAALQLPHAGGDLLAPLLAALTGRHALLVLDNFEQVLEEGAPVVGELLNRLPELHMLVTSRRVLGLDGEREFPIDPLALPATGSEAHDALTTPSVALFIDRARAARPGFDAAASNVNALIALAHLLEGMPLAIELAAARARSMSPAEMATLLAAARHHGGPSLELLKRTGPRHATDARHASMVGVIEWSWRMLSETHARLLAALTVFQSGFTADAAEAVCGDLCAPVSLGLDELVSHSLLRVGHAAGDTGTTRFTASEPIREYAMRQLAAADARLRREKHRLWMIDWAGSLPATPSLDAVRTEMPNVMAALADAIAEEPDHALQMLVRLHRVLEDVELPAEGLSLIEQALPSCQDTGLRSRAHTLLAPLLFIAGHRERARDHAAQGLALAAPGSPWRGRALHAVARIEWRSTREPLRIEPWLDEAESLLAAGADLDLHAAMHALRANIATSRGLHARGEALHGQALALWEQLGNQHAVNSGRYNLAAIVQTAGRHTEALERLAPIEASARELNDWRRLSQALNVRGNALSELRRWPEAVHSFRESIRLAWNCMAMHELAFGLWNLPRALAHLRDAERAIQLSAFAAMFWESRFGALNAGDHHDLRRVARLTAAVPPARAAELARRGRALSPADAVALALDRHAMATPTTGR